MRVRVAVVALRVRETRAWTSAATLSASACGTGFCPTTATGAVSQRPTHGAVQHAHLRAEQRRQRSQQLARAGEVAGDRVADAHRDRRAAPSRLPSPRRSGDRTWRPRRPPPSPSSSRRRARPGGPPTGSQSDPECVQVLDQQIAAPRRIAEQRAHLGSRARIDAPTFRRGAFPRPPVRSLFVPSVLRALMVDELTIAHRFRVQPAVQDDSARHATSFRKAHDAR